MCANKIGIINGKTENFVAKAKPKTIPTKIELEIFIICQIM